MACINMYVGSDVMHVNPVHWRPGSLWLLIWMSTMHAHGLAAAYRHDHAWTDNLTQNICMLYTPLSPMRAWYVRRQGHRRHRFYGTEGKWINCLTCFPLLNVGFLTILKRTDCFVLIWACIAVLAVHHNCHFQNCLPLQKRNPQKRQCSSVYHAVLRNDVSWAAW